MPWSVHMPDGTWEDVHFRKGAGDPDGSWQSYHFYLGRECLGLVTRTAWMGPAEWSAMSLNFPPGMEAETAKQRIEFQTVRRLELHPERALLDISGFRTRRAAGRYILRHHGYGHAFRD